MLDKDQRSVWDQHKSKEDLFMFRNRRIDLWGTGIRLPNTHSSEVTRA
jgi:hypothetical protein